jgi:hypothetical protein
MKKSYTLHGCLVVLGWLIGWAFLGLRRKRQ